ncbi:MAG TPA: FAD-dependent oxidoreductase [Thermoplasmata archaeon]|nr:FAD-dependent oxidoreductase [Thermoplasmata archaeon]
MARSSPPEPSGPGAVILGAGYAGVRLAHAVARLGRGRLRVRLVDRHPLHVLRTELYEIGRLAGGPRAVERFTLPISRVLGGTDVGFVQGEVDSIDLGGHRVTISGTPLEYDFLAICLGSAPAYYGVPGASEHTHSVYRLRSAQKLAQALRDLEAGSIDWPAGRRPEVVVVGGGSTGCEVAAEIATVRWGAIAGRGARRPHVRLITGSLPFLAGFSPSLIRHARDLLGSAGVEMIEGVNAARVSPGSLELERGSSPLSFDLCVWAAGVQAPDVVRKLPVPHGHSGRIVVDPTLEVPGHAGVFAVGDTVDLVDPVTRVVVPATAQAALSEASVAGANLVARWRGTPLREFHYREKGAIVSVGQFAASGRTRHLTLWGAPAKLLKRAVEREYAIAAERSQFPLTSR